MPRFAVYFSDEFEAETLEQAENKLLAFLVDCDMNRDVSGFSIQQIENHDGVTVEPVAETYVVSSVAELRDVLSDFRGNLLQTGLAVQVNKTGQITIEPVKG